jgi:hypothetical protein
MPTYSPDTILIVPPFIRQQDADEVIIGRMDTGVFLAVPPGAVEVLDYLAEGKSVGEAAALYEQKHGEVPDLDEFLGLLESKGIVEPLTNPAKNRSSAPPAESAGRRVHYHFRNFPQQLAQRIFSAPALTAYLIIAAAGVVLVILDPSLLPRSGDLYFPDYRTLSWAVVVLVSYGGLFVHEFSHLVAARALGINSRMGISNRLWYLVAETDLTGLWGVPKRQRYLPLFAGAITDAVFWAILVFMVYASDRRWIAFPRVAVRLLHAAAVTFVMRVLWQCFLFVRTDFYYVIASLFNCRNLLNDTEVFLRNQLARIIPTIRRVSQADIPGWEQRVIRVYAALWLAGRIFAVALLFTITIPLAISYTRALGETIRSGYSGNPAKFVDALLLATYFFVPLTLGLVMWIRGLFRSERTSA